MNKRSNFGGDRDHRLDTGIVFWILNYWEIWKVVINGHNISAAHTDSPDGVTGNTCLGGCMHFPCSASSYISRESKTTRNVLWSGTSVCLSVCGRMPTLLHGPGCNLGVVGDTH